MGEARSTLQCSGFCSATASRFFQRLRAEQRPPDVEGKEILVANANGELAIHTGPYPQEAASINFEDDVQYIKTVYTLMSSDSESDSE